MFLRKTNNLAYFVSNVMVLVALMLAVLIIAPGTVFASELAGLQLASNKISPECIPPEISLPNPGSPTQSISASQAGQPNNAQSAPLNNGQSFLGNNTNNSYPPSNPSSTINNSPPPSNLGVPANNISAPANQGTPADNRPDPIAIIETVKGNITVRLFREYAPKTVANFIEIVNTGFYNGLTFHRVEPGFCIQGGCPRGDGFGVYTDPNTKQPRMLALETNPHLKHNAPGVVAMAHFPKSPNSSSSQFYITLSAQPQLDGDYSIFGGVVQGMDVVNKIAIGDKINRITLQERN